MDRNGDEAAGGSRRRSRSLDAPVLIALASVLVALVYNGLQVRNSAQQLDQGQRNLERANRADEFASFMQMQDRIVRTDAETADSIVAFLKVCHYSGQSGECARGNEGQWGPAALKLVRVITPFEGVVYALEHGALPAETGELWTIYLVCDYQSTSKALEAATVAESGPGLAGYLPRLARFAARHPVPQERCREDF